MPEQGLIWAHMKHTDPLSAPLLLPKALAPGLLKPQATGSFYSPPVGPVHLPWPLEGPKPDERREATTEWSTGGFSPFQKVHWATGKCFFPKKLFVFVPPFLGIAMMTGHLQQPKCCFLRHFFDPGRHENNPQLVAIASVRTSHALKNIWKNNCLLLKDLSLFFPTSAASKSDYMCSDYTPRASCFCQSFSETPLWLHIVSYAMRHFYVHILWTPWNPAFRPLFSLNQQTNLQTQEWHGNAWGVKFKSNLRSSGKRQTCFLSRHLTEQLQAQEILLPWDSLAFHEIKR